MRPGYYPPPNGTWSTPATEHFPYEDWGDISQPWQPPIRRGHALKQPLELGVEELEASGVKVRRVTEPRKR